MTVKFNAATATAVVVAIVRNNADSYPVLGGVRARALYAAKRGEILLPNMEYGNYFNEEEAKKCFVKGLTALDAGDPELAAAHLSVGGGYLSQMRDNLHAALRVTLLGESQEEASLRAWQIEEGIRPLAA
jgi:hypothetical protein